MKNKWIEEDSNSYLNPTSSTTADSIAPVSGITPTPLTLTPETKTAPVIASTASTDS